MRTITKILIGLAALALIAVATGGVAWRSGALDRILARLDIDRVLSIETSRGERGAWDPSTGFDRRGPGEFFRDGRGDRLNRVAGWGRFGRLPIVAGLALVGALSIVGGLAALGALGLRTLVRRNRPTPPPAPPAPPAEAASGPASTS